MNERTYKTLAFVLMLKDELVQHISDGKTEENCCEALRSVNEHVCAGYLDNDIVFDESVILSIYTILVGHAMNNQTCVEIYDAAIELLDGFVGCCGLPIDVADNIIGKASFFTKAYTEGFHITKEDDE